MNEASITLTDTASLVNIANVLDSTKETALQNLRKIKDIDEDKMKIKKMIRIENRYFRDASTGKAILKVEKLLKHLDETHFDNLSSQSHQYKAQVDAKTMKNLIIDSTNDIDNEAAKGEYDDLAEWMYGTADVNFLREKRKNKNVGMITNGRISRAALAVWIVYERFVIEARRTKRAGLSKTVYKKMKMLMDNAGLYDEEDQSRDNLLIDYHEKIVSESGKKEVENLERKREKHSSKLEHLENKTLDGKKKTFSKKSSRRILNNAIGRSSMTVLEKNDPISLSTSENGDEDEYSNWSYSYSTTTEDETSNSIRSSKSLADARSTFSEKNELEFEPPGLAGQNALNANQTYDEKHMVSNDVPRGKSILNELKFAPGDLTRVSVFSKRMADRSSPRNNEVPAFMKNVVERALNIDEEYFENEFSELAEESEQKDDNEWFYLDLDRNEFGPFTSKQMLEWWNCDLLDPQVEIRRKGINETYRAIGSFNKLPF
eukprot:g3584.t1